MGQGITRGKHADNRRRSWLRVNTPYDRTMTRLTSQRSRNTRAVPTSDRARRLCSRERAARARSLDRGDERLARSSPKVRASTARVPVRASASARARMFVGEREAASSIDGGGGDTVGSSADIGERETCRTYGHLALPLHFICAWPCSRGGETGRER